HGAERPRRKHPTLEHGLGQAPRRIRSSVAESRLRRRLTVGYLCMKESMMKLYGFPPSPNTWKVRACAAHLGIPLEFELVDLSRGEQRQPAYLALNPTGRTPTLADGDFTLWESNAILQYIASRTSNSLWPNDDRVRADVTR